MRLSAVPERFLSRELRRRFLAENEDVPMKITQILAASAAVAGMAAPAAAQVPYGQPYPPQYPPAYGYQQGNPIQQVIDQLLGNRYNVNDRTAVQRCATAALAHAAQRYPQAAYGQQQYGQPPYGNAYGYNRNNPYAAMRVTAVQQVERIRNGVRVRGLISTGARAAYVQPGYGQPGYGQPGYGQPGYGDPRYAQQQVVSDLQFRCNVDYRGAITNLRVTRNNPYRR